MSKIEKIFNKVSRRSSETAADGLLRPVSTNDNSRNIRSRVRSLSTASSTSVSNINISPMPSNDTRKSSKSVSKRQTKELIKKETKLVTLKKLSTLLNDLGLQEPVPIKTTKSNSSGLSKNINIYVANSNNCIYLAPATSASFTYEDVENGGSAEGDDDDEFDDHSRSNSVTVEDDEINPTTQNVPPELRSKLGDSGSPNYLSTKIDSDTPIPHTFAVIVELNKDTVINSLEIEFSSIASILWPSGDPYNKSFSRERFKIGKLKWDKSLKNPDFFINNLNSGDLRSKKLDQDELARRTRFYRLREKSDVATAIPSMDTYPLENDSSLNSEIDSSGYDSSPQTYKAGIYMFILPILLPESIPPTITSINGSLAHMLAITIHKTSEKLNRKLKYLAGFNLPMVRTPPSLANSIADKPIYVNRVWNDSLHYIITFPRKYVSLGNEHSINVKVVPLVKDVVIKRIKFNVLERITYVSKDLAKEYDYDGEDPHCLRSLINDDKKVRERVVPICELKTKNKPTTGYTEPYKEEVVKCPDNNLLFSCYESDPKRRSAEEDSDSIENFRLSDNSNRSRAHSHGAHLSPKAFSRRRYTSPTPEAPENYMVASPLDINIALPFLTTRNDKIIQASNDENELRKLPSVTSSSPSSRKASIISTEGPNNNFTPSSPIIGSLATNLSHIAGENFDGDEHVDFLTPDSTALMHEVSHNHFKENIHHGFTIIGRALYPDSNFRHIKIHHRLQVCFRISKPDPKDNYKMHHYEVVIDTPLILLSSKCNEENIQLPKYDEIDVTTTPLKTTETPRKSEGISFRTPNFDRSNVGINTSVNGEIHGQGLSIKPWNNEETKDSLPSFEEATSPISAPVTRSFSVAEDPLSRIPSISIDSGLPLHVPATASPDPPAYEESSYRRESVLGNPLNLDAIVTKGEPEASNLMKSSSIRSSLVQSFAPPLQNSSSVSNSLKTSLITDTEPMSFNGSSLSVSEEPESESVVSLDSYPPVVEDTSSDSLGSNSFSQSDSLPTTGSSGQLPDNYSTAITTDDSSQNTKEMDQIRHEQQKQQKVQEAQEAQEAQEYHEQLDPANESLSLDPEVTLGSEVSQSNDSDDELQEDDPLYKGPKLTSLPNDSETNVSIMTHGSAYDQRIPLLRNTSTESNIPLAKQITIQTHNKPSTDNLSIITESNQGQDIYHAY